MNVITLIEWNLFSAVENFLLFTGASTHFIGQFTRFDLFAKLNAPMQSMGGCIRRVVFRVLTAFECFLSIYSVCADDLMRLIRFIWKLYEKVWWTNSSSTENWVKFGGRTPQKKTFLACIFGLIGIIEWEKKRSTNNICIVFGCFTHKAEFTLCWAQNTQQKGLNFKMFFIWQWASIATMMNKRMKCYGIGKREDDG